MNKLYIFACSYGMHGYVTTPPQPYVWKDSGSFGDVLAKKFNLDLVNKSEPGICNFHILKRILDCVDTIDETDTVVVQWTYINRAFFAVNGKTVMPHVDNKVFASYYENFYDDVQSLYTLMGFNSYVESKIKGRYFFSIVDNLTDIKSISPTVYNELLNNKAFVRVNDGDTVVTPVEYIKPKKEIQFYCGHPTSAGHEIISNFYYRYCCDEREKKV